MAVINREQIRKVAEVIKVMPEKGHVLNFYSFPGKDGEIVATDMYPPLNHWQTINFFSFVCMHQFGFWYGDDHGYLKPLFATFDGKQKKGSDALWMACMRAFTRNELTFEPDRFAGISPREFAAILSDDNGPIPFPDFETRFIMTRRYGKYFHDGYPRLAIYPEDVIRNANSTDSPLRSFRDALCRVPGYDEDPLAKKNMLLAMALANRPERFLDVRDPENWLSITDYHVMRIVLRLGLVVLDPDELRKVKNRAWVSKFDEENIRRLIHEANNMLIKESGRPMPFVDNVLWTARRYCPEMETPDCPKCIFTDICAKHIELFQPVFRTTAY